MATNGFVGLETAASGRRRRRGGVAPAATRRTLWRQSSSLLSPTTIVMIVLVPVQSVPRYRRPISGAATETDILLAVSDTGGQAPPNGANKSAVNARHLYCSRIFYTPSGAVLHRFGHLRPTSVNCHRARTARRWRLQNQSSGNGWVLSWPAGSETALGR